MNVLATRSETSGNTSLTEGGSNDVEMDSLGLPFREMVANGAKRLSIAQDPMPEVFAKSFGKSSFPANDEITQTPLLPSVITLGDAFQSRVVGKRTMHTLQEWEGFVERVEKEFFVAQLQDLTDLAQAVEFAQIPINVVERDDRHRIEPGAVFRMTVGIAKTDRGNRVNDAVIYFRRFTENNIGAQVADLIRSFDEE